MIVRVGEFRGGRARGREGFLEEGRLELSLEGFGKLRGEEVSRSGFGEVERMKGGRWFGWGYRGSRRMGSTENF